MFLSYLIDHSSSPASNLILNFRATVSISFSTKSSPISSSKAFLSINYDLLIKKIGLSTKLGDWQSALPEFAERYHATL